MHQRNGEVFVGMRLTYRIYNGVEPWAFRAEFERTLNALGGSLDWNKVGKGDNALGLATSGSVHTVDIPYQSTDFAFCWHLGRSLNACWLELRIQEGSIWDYALFRGGETIDLYSVCPQYWDGPDTTEEQLIDWAGKPDLLADSWGIPVSRIRNYFANWGYQELPEEGVIDYTRSGKAFPNDVSDYGDYWQMLDFMKALGAAQPDYKYSIVLPKRIEIPD
jgi:hypothetical protein